MYIIYTCEHNDKRSSRADLMANIVMCPDCRVVGAPDFGSRGPGFESRWRRISAHDYALRRTELLNIPPSIASV